MSKPIGSRVGSLYSTAGGVPARSRAGRKSASGALVGGMPVAGRAGSTLVPNMSKRLAPMASLAL
jgi:hypothetical protein